MYGPEGSRFLLPGLVPEESIASLNAGMHQLSVEMLQVYHELNAKLVITKVLKDLLPARSRGPLLRAQLFGMFQISMSRGSLHYY